MRFLAFSFAAVLGVGCATESSTPEMTHPQACSAGGEACRLSGSELGKEGATIKLDHGVTATFKDWIPLAGQPGKWVGFTVTLTGNKGKVFYVVNSGGESHVSSDGTWKHRGSDCDGIDDIDYGAGVDQEDPTGGGGGDDGGDGSGCDNADGCNDGGSGPIL